GDFIHTQKREPQTNLKPPWMKWDFWSLSPESLHQVTILFSDRGTPKSYRHMHGFSSHTFSFIDAQGERVWIKFHFKTVQGIENLTADEAVQLAGSSPDHATEDLFESIEQGNYPKWQVCVQIMTQAEADNLPFNPFDLTKVWPQGDYPLIEVGEMELNRNPENYHAEVEQAAFCPAHVVQGIGFSPDKMLQARILSYTDAHRYRLGVNYQSLPVNQPKAEVNTYNRDGAMRFDGNYGGTVNYEPNSFGGPTEDPAYREPAFPVDGHGDRYDHRAGNDDYTQTGDLYRLLAPDAQARLIENIVGGMMPVPRRIQTRQLVHFYRADADYGRRIAQGLGVDVDLDAWSALSLRDLIAATAEGTYDADNDRVPQGASVAAD
ncbi:MAG: catalase, partial [Litorilinea sp.]